MVFGVEFDSLIDGFSADPLKTCIFILKIAGNAKSLIVAPFKGFLAANCLNLPRKGIEPD